MLGLELGEHNGKLRHYNPDIGKWLQSLQEEVKSVREHAEQETNARIIVEERAEQEANARMNAEDELTKALAEIERLRSEKYSQN